MTSAATLAPGSGFTGATATASTGLIADACGIVTFTTSTTIPGSGPYLLFTVTFSTSWASSYPPPIAFTAFPCANPVLSRTASQMAACAALGPFFVIPNSPRTTLAVYCTSAPSESTAYDIGFMVLVGP